MSSKNILIKEILPKNMDTIIPLVAQLNKDVSDKALRQRLSQMITKDFHCLGAYEGETLVGVAGYWLGFRLWCGKYIDVDNFVVDENHRNKGIGKLLMKEIYKIAKTNECDISVLDTYTQNHKSHKFYHHEDYQIVGFHFYKKLN